MLRKFKEAGLKEVRMRLPLVFLYSGSLNGHPRLLASCTVVHRFSLEVNNSKFEVLLYHLLAIVS